MGKSIPNTPSRRSQRFQPTATPTSKGIDQNILECEWASKAYYVRRTVPGSDLLPEEQQGNSEGDVDDTDGPEESELSEMETIFYEAFRMKRKATAYRGSKRMKLGKTETQTYRVGDTVMVETDSLYIMKRPPSIGVLVAMWEVRRKGEGLHAPTDTNKMYLRIHWFLRPTELASIRAKREHKENEIYYSLATRVIVTPSVILSRCVVNSEFGPSQKGKGREYIAPTPFKGNLKAKSRSPQKTSTKSRIAYASSEEATDDESPKEGDDADRTMDDPEKIFCCGFAVDSRRGIFYRFKWDRHRQSALAQSVPPQLEEDDLGSKRAAPQWGEGHHWNVEEKKLRSSDQKGKEIQDSSESDINSFDEYQDRDPPTDSDVEIGVVDASESEGDDNVDDAELDGYTDPRTPSKKRKRRQESATTPSKSKRKKTVVQPTPHSKAALEKRRKRNISASPRKRKSMASFPVRYPDQTLGFQETMAHLPKDPWLRSMHALHVGSRPNALPCREEEYARVLRSVGELLEEGSGGCIYISGVPGTGKTATVHTIIRELKRMAENNEINPFTYVEINGLKIPEPSAAYSLLWEGVSGHDVTKDGHLRVSSKDSLKALTQHFMIGNRGPEGHACVVLMDELDQLVTPKQDVIYNFFNWPTLVGSKLVVIAVANTMDLPERVMTGRVRSRLGMIRINFQPYTREQLEKIVEARLASAKEGLGKEAASKAIIAPDAIKLASMTVSRITGDARRVLDICRRAVELVLQSKGTAKAPQVKEVVQMMQNSPTAAYLRGLSLHERLMLTSLIKCIKREGVEEIKWSEVEHQHLVYTNVLTDRESTRQPTPAEFKMVLNSLVASRAVVLEDGAAVARKPEAERRLLLNIEQGEVERVLGDVGGQKWKNVLSN